MQLPKISWQQQGLFLYFVLLTCTWTWLLITETLIITQKKKIQYQCGLLNYAINSGVIFIMWWNSCLCILDFDAKVAAQKARISSIKSVCLSVSGYEDINLWLLISKAQKIEVSSSKDDFWLWKEPQETGSEICKCATIFLFLKGLVHSTILFTGESGSVGPIVYWLICQKNVLICKSPLRTYFKVKVLVV